LAFFVAGLGLLLAGPALQCGSSPHTGPCILLQQTALQPLRANADLPDSNQAGAPQTVQPIVLRADSAPATIVTLGSVDKSSGFKFLLELTSRGAAISKAIFSEFNNRDQKNPQPLVVIWPVRQRDGSQIMSMANAGLVFAEYGLQLPLDRLDWESYDRQTNDDASQTVRFEALIRVQDTNEPVAKLIKTYTLRPDSYLIDCDLAVENLSSSDQKVYFNLNGPAGINKEGVRGDMRKVVAGFRDTNGQIVSTRLDKKALTRPKKVPDDLELKMKRVGPKFLWAATVNEYFAAILVPLPEQGKDSCDWLPEANRIGRFYNPDGDSRADSGDETIGVELKTTPANLAAAGQDQSTRTYKFQLYIGPKDKSHFDKIEQYRALGFVQTIDFAGCCCPSSIINPLAFGIMALMKWMYGFIPNFGIVIIILVFLFRLVLHPITKKSQVAMSKMSKLAPMAEEIRKKYANNKAEMNKQMMQLYRQQGASPIMGFLPMFVQLPIWIALWSAIYTSIDLRGAAFLPVWITDLSVPDALVRFPTLAVPLVGWKINALNLLPILMGVAFYLQQKLTPQQASASANPQVAQQQKMMMIMMPLLFPLMLYTAPSGVNLYIMASTFAGVVEQYVIRKHIRDKEEAESQGLVCVTSKTGGKVKKKKPKPFFRI
jgi:YidC/Oxa1 family membrane protein insertase